MKSGLYPSVPWESYDKVDACRSVWLTHLKRSPAHLKAFIEESPRMPSKALILGRAIHRAILEPERLMATYCCSPNVDRRTKSGREIWDSFIQQSVGMEILTQDEMNQVLAIAESCHKNQAAMEALNFKSTEVSIFWDDPTTLVHCKGRLDSYDAEKQGGILTDIKSCRNAEAYTFEKDIWIRGYARQMAWYRWGLRELGYVVSHCLIVALEKEPPYGVQVFRLHDDLLTKFEEENCDLLKKLDYCQKNNYWEAYPPIIQDINLPDWARKILETDLMQITNRETEEGVYE